MTPSEGQNFVRRMLQAFADFNVPVEQLTQFFTADYVQTVDGNKLDLAGFLDHARALRSALTELDVSIERIVSDGSSAATVHVARAVKRAGEEAHVKVVAFYHFRSGRICQVDELTYVVQGNEGDIELGSVMSKYSGDS